MQEASRVQDSVGDTRSGKEIEHNTGEGRNESFSEFNETAFQLELRQDKNGMMNSAEFECSQVRISIRDWVRSKLSLQMNILILVLDQ